MQVSGESQHGHPIHTSFLQHIPGWHQQQALSEAGLDGLQMSALIW